MIIPYSTVKLKRARENHVEYQQMILQQTAHQLDAKKKQIPVNGVVIH